MVALSAVAFVGSACGDESSEDRPNEREARFLAAVERTSGDKVADQYRQLLACARAIDSEIAVPEPPKERVDFSYTLFPFGEEDREEMRRAGGVCELFL